jgi:hypothetical protein
MRIRMVLASGGCPVPDVGDVAAVMNEPGVESGARHQSYLTAPPPALAAAALLFSRSTTCALGLVAGMTLGLVFIGIHDAWDSITYVAADVEDGRAGPRRTGGRAGH